MAARAVVAALAVIGASASLTACGSDHRPPRAALRSRRADLARVGRALLEARTPLLAEVAAARRAWPLIDRGLRSEQRQGQVKASRRARAAEAATVAARGAAVSGAAADARGLRLSLLAEPESLTGAAAGLAGVYELAAGLLAHGWPQVEAAARAGPGDSPRASFLRANVDTYITAVYDGHFDLSLLGRTFRRAYLRLGGAKAFGPILSQAQLGTIATAYSPRAMRLRPHPWQALLSE